MHAKTRKHLNGGFTLIEVLVTLILLALLVAAVFPVVVQQIDDADPTRAANDLASIRTGIELFSLNVRPYKPGDLDDLANQIVATTDLDIDGEAYPNSNVTDDWEGPYIDLTVPNAAGDGTSEFATGFGVNIQDAFVCYNPSAATSVDAVRADGACATGDFVSVQVLDFTETQFEAINDIIDGTTDSGSNSGADGGKWRARQSNGQAITSFASTDAAYYLAVPFRN